MKAEMVLHHDDPPCDARLVDGYCPPCGFTPDMQSTAFHYYCPTCHTPLKKMKCRVCKKTFEKAG
jgi:hypothetical protein